MDAPWGVGELAVALRDMLRSSELHTVLVRGELSRYTVASSGHAYFSLKDDEGKLDCVAWRSRVSSFPDGLEEGMEVVVLASVDLYPPQGRIQLQVQSLEASTSLGLLEEVKRRLVERLREDGSLDRLNRPLPLIPKHLVIVTGGGSAALSDMLRLRDERWPGLKTTVVETVVQGRESIEAVPRALRAAYSLSPSVVVVGRGGGSAEDLWTFNLEPVIEAILESPVPIVSAVGHESDHLVSDLVADHRAATPTHAMEMVIPRRGDHDIMIDDLESRMRSSLHRWVLRRRERISGLRSRLVLAPLLGIEKARRRLQRISSVLELTDPRSVLKRGYSMVTSADGRLVRSVADAPELMRLEFHDGSLMARKEDD